jgi:hypothetical protein
MKYIRGNQMETLFYADQYRNYVLKNAGHPTVETAATTGSAT